MMTSKAEGRTAPHLLFFGAYDPGYPRNLIIRTGWRKLGFTLSECRTGTKRKVYTRYPALLFRYMREERRGRILFVPDFRHKDVPLAWALGRLTGKKVVFDPLVSRYETRVLDRGDVGKGSLQAWHNRNLDGISFNLPDIVLADTSAHAAFYHESFGVERERIGLLPVGFDEETFRHVPPRRGEGPLRVLFYGSFLPLHGVDTIIEAASALTDRPIRFRIVGGGQTHGETRRLAESRRLANVEFLPPVPYGGLQDLISESDVVLGIFGKTKKASMVVPNKVYQALAVGRAVVTAGTPAIDEFFNAGEHLLTVPQGEPDALADAIRALESDRGLGFRLAETGGSLVRSVFDSKSIAGRLRGIIEELGP